MRRRFPMSNEKVRRTFEQQPGQMAVARNRATFEVIEGAVVVLLQYIARDLAREPGPTARHTPSEWTIKVEEPA